MKQDPLEQDIFQGEREIHFTDIINVALETNEKSQSIIELISLMRSEVSQNNLPDGSVQLNYNTLFKIFVRLRKIKLLRYLFGQKLEFEFNVSIFIMALEEDAYDIAALLHKEFSYLMRDNSNEDNRKIVS